MTEGITIDICVMQNGKYTACASGNIPQDISSTSSSSSSSTSSQPLSEVDLTFAKFDTNKDGQVSLSELKIGLVKELSSTTNNNNMKEDDVSIKTVQQLISDYDKSGDGTLQPNEFVSIYTFYDSLDSYNAGLAGWAVALIIIFVLLFVCCAGYAVAVVCFGVANIFDYCFNYDDDYGEDRTTTKIRHDIFDDDDEQSRRSRQTIMSNILLIDNGNNRGSDTGELALIDEEEMTMNTYSTRGTMSTIQQQRSRMGRDPTMYYPGNTVGRDPTMYIPGREDATDPRSSVDDNTYYSEDEDQSRMKVKRDPTMYVGGLRGSYYYTDSSKQPRREPTMYVDGTEYKPQRGQPSMYSVDDSTIEEVHTDYRVSGSGGAAAGGGGGKGSFVPNHDDSYVLPEDTSVSMKSFRSARSTRKQTHKSYGAPRKTNSYYK